MTAMVRASGLRGYTALMRESGMDPLPFLARHGIAPEALEDDDALISLPAAMRLLEASAAATGHADFGLQMARVQDISVLGPLAVAMQNAPTVAGALRDASNYLFMHSPAMLLSVRDAPVAAGGLTEIRFEIRLPTRLVRRQGLDLCLGDIHNILKILAGSAYVLHLVTLPHTPVAPLAVYRRFFGVPILPASEHAGLHIEPTTLQATRDMADENLRQIAMDYLARNFSTPDADVSERVEQALRGTLGTPHFNRQEVAQLLAMHPRTLQRHLKAEQTSFVELRDQVRKQAALRYLCQTRVPLGQLAGLLSLSEHSALTRSCQRWFGASPTTVRKRSTQRFARRDPQPQDSLR